VRSLFGLTLCAKLRLFAILLNSLANHEAWIAEYQFNTIKFNIRCNTKLALPLRFVSHNL